MTTLDGGADEHDVVLLSCESYTSLSVTKLETGQIHVQ